MLKLTFLTLIILIAPFANASEYCEDQYSSKITQANSELGGLVKRQSEIDKRIAEIYIKMGQLYPQIAAAAAKTPPDISAIQDLGSQMSTINIEKTALESEGFKNLDRIVGLKGSIPTELQAQLRGCVEATAPTNHLVNLTIQALAILSTGGASLILPPKSLYVDMSAVLNGYPTGGSASVINQARDSALNALPFGLGNPRNDVGKVLRDPGSIIRGIKF